MTNESTRVTLTREEMVWCAAVGAGRRIDSVLRGRRGAHGFNREYEAWSIDIEGVMCEFASAKHFGLKYQPTDGELDTKKGDIGPGIQVRGTRYDAGSLLLHATDADDDRFILVTGSSGEYRLRGWIHARDGKLDKLWQVQKGRGAYWVGQNWLKPISTFEVPRDS